jgi:hypothetical protein
MTQLIGIKEFSVKEVTKILNGFQKRKVIKILQQMELKRKLKFGVMSVSKVIAVFEMVKLIKS